VMIGLPVGASGTSSGALSFDPVADRDAIFPISSLGLSHLQRAPFADFYFEPLSFELIRLPMLDVISYFPEIRISCPYRESRRGCDLTLGLSHSQ
jgi:hypothetical protein